MRIVAATVALSALLGVASCGSGGSEGAEGTTAVPDGAFCEVVLAWSNAVVGTVNHFSRVSPDAADLAARRQLYLGAWDGLDQVSSWVDAAADRAPEGIRAALHGAADSVRAELAIGRARAVDLPDRAYEYASVSDGTLFVTGEKSRAVVYQALDDVRDDLGEETVPKACGRPTEPVTLPVVTPP